MINYNETIDNIAQYFTNNADTSDLMQYFYDGQLDFLNGLNESDLLKYIKEYDLSHLIITED